MIMEFIIGVLILCVVFIGMMVKKYFYEEEEGD